MSQEVSASDLRNIISKAIAGSIELHRLSRSVREESYVKPEQPEPTEDEITDFALSNPMFESETVWQIVDPGLLGFHSSKAITSEEWLEEFRGSAQDWSETQEWQAADLVYYHADAVFEPVKRELWTPNDRPHPSSVFLASSPSHLLLAEKLIREGRLLSEMGWREFERLIGELLEADGWQVQVMRGTKDGGIDVHSEKTDKNIGVVKAIWQAKKYGADKKVSLNHIRELSGLADRHRPSKAVLVTTSSLTKGVIDWIRKDAYRLSAKDGRELESWVRRVLAGD